jgi:hypothetical protein
MTPESFFYYSLYETGLWAGQKWPWLWFVPGYKNTMDLLFPFWEMWQIKATMENVDQQVEIIADQWETDEKEAKSNALVAEAQELFPRATVTPLPNAIVPSVMIVTEAPESASEGVKALGGELRITYAPNGLK